MCQTAPSHGGLLEAHAQVRNLKGVQKEFGRDLERIRASEKGEVEELKGGHGVCHWLNCIDGIASCVSLLQVMEDYWKLMPK